MEEYKAKIQSVREAKEKVQLLSEMLSDFSQYFKKSLEKFKHLSDSEQDFRKIVDSLNNEKSSIEEAIKNSKTHLQKEQADWEERKNKEMKQIKELHEIAVREKDEAGKLLESAKKTKIETDKGMEEYSKKSRDLENKISKVKELAA